MLDLRSVVPKLFNPIFSNSQPPQIAPNRKEIGVAFKKEAKAVTDYLEGMAECDALELKVTGGVISPYSSNAQWFPWGQWPAYCCGINHALNCRAMIGQA